MKSGLIILTTLLIMLVVSSCQPVFITNDAVCSKIKPISIPKKIHYHIITTKTHFNDWRAFASDVVNNEEIRAQLCG